MIAPRSSFSSAAAWSSRYFFRSSGLIRPWAVRISPSVFPDLGDTVWVTRPSRMKIFPLSSSLSKVRIPDF
jgi:hypothetical protein